MKCFIIIYMQQIRNRHPHDARSIPSLIIMVRAPHYIYFKADF